MEMSQANELLTQNPHPFETGYKVLDSGIGFVANRTELPGCSGAMVKWWFETLSTTELYKRWHPADHVYLKIKRPGGDGAVGTRVIIHERLGKDPVLKLKLNFRDPGAVIDTSKFATAGITAAVYARGGPQHLPLWTGNVLHLVYDTPDGAVMRSRFWMGDVAPAVPLLAGVIRREMTSESALSALLTHCKAEMRTLATILPDLYAGRE